MVSSLRKLLFLAALFAAWETLLRPIGVQTVFADTPPPAEKPNEELARLFAEDQGDRNPGAGGSINWLVVAPRDKARLARVREIYRRAELRAGADYYHAAMVLQHGGEPSAYLLAHELCVVAIGKGEERAKWLAAASEDRYLRSIKRPQRFGTQYTANGPGAPFRLDEMEDGVSDGLRRAFNAPTLEQAKAREAEMNK